jgi:hypothetical protein
MYPCPTVRIKDRAFMKKVLGTLEGVTYRVYGDRHIPESKPDVPWE